MDGWIRYVCVESVRPRPNHSSPITAGKIQTMSLCVSFSVCLEVHVFWERSDSVVSTQSVVEIPSIHDNNELKHVPKW